MAQAQLLHDGFADGARSADNDDLLHFESPVGFRSEASMRSVTTGINELSFR
jgi:hypothetical protein